MLMPVLNSISHLHYQKSKPPPPPPKKMDIISHLYTSKCTINMGIFPLSICFFFLPVQNVEKMGFYRGGLPFALSQNLNN